MFEVLKKRRERLHQVMGVTEESCRLCNPREREETFYQKTLREITSTWIVHFQRKMKNPLGERDLMLARSYLKSLQDVLDRYEKEGEKRDV